MFRCCSHLCAFFPVGSAFLFPLTHKFWSSSELQFVCCLPLSPVCSFPLSSQFQFTSEFLYCQTVKIYVAFFGIFGCFLEVVCRFTSSCMACLPFFFCSFQIQILILIYSELFDNLMSLNFVVWYWTSIRVRFFVQHRPHKLSSSYLQFFFIWLLVFLVWLLFI